jgi:hypothetical protein
MYTSLGVAAIFVALLGVMVYCARVLLPLISPVSRVLVILLPSIFVRPDERSARSTRPPRGSPWWRRIIG